MFCNPENTLAFRSRGWSEQLAVFIRLSVQGGGFPYALNGFHPATGPPCPYFIYFGNPVADWIIKKMLYKRA